MKKKTKAEKKISKVYREFKAGTLKSSSGQLVTNPKQALAIALSQAGVKRKDEWYKDKSEAYCEGYMCAMFGGESEEEGMEEEEPEEEEMMDGSCMEKEDEFTDKSLHSAIVGEAKKKFEVYPSRYAGYWIAQEYEKRFKKKHGSMKGAYKGKKDE